jgi:8-oxo-dGTP diphosphatase
VTTSRRSESAAAAEGPLSRSVDWTSWQPVDRATLCFVVRGAEVLLIRKKRGLGAGKINGPGGRLDPGEAPLSGAVREVEEELGTTPLDLQLRGELSFQFLDGYSIHVYVFISSAHRGEPRETPEAIPLFCPIDALPFDEMWEDDRYWLPLLFAGKRFAGRYVFDGDRMLEQELTLL